MDTPETSVTRSLYDVLLLTRPELGVPSVSRIPEKTDDELLALTGEEFCRGIVESYEYRRSILRRIASDSLPPAVECRLLDHALGKPADTLVVRPDLTKLPHEDLVRLEQALTVTAVTVQ